MQAGFEYGTASATQKDGDNEASASYTNMGLYFRYFFGNSFNVFAAAHSRKWTADVTLSETDNTCPGNTCTADVEMTAAATVATLGVGNHWTLDFGLTLGVDWIFASGIIGSSTTSSVSANTGWDVAELATEISDFADLLNQASALPGFLNFTIGWSF